MRRSSTKTSDSVNCRVPSSLNTPLLNRSREALTKVIELSIVSSSHFIMARKAACFSMRDGSLHLSLARAIIARRKVSQLEALVTQLKTFPAGRYRISSMRKAKAPIISGCSFGCRWQAFTSAVARIISRVGYEILKLYIQVK